MPISTVQTITQAEYARRRGCTEGAVRRAVRDGRITLIDGKVDPVAADAQWARNTRVRAGSRPTDDAHLQVAGSPVGGFDSASSREDPDAYYIVKARREKAEAEIAELKLAELRGDVVRASDVRAAWAKKTAALREATLQIPSRLAPVLSAESDQHRVHDLLQAELHAVLAQLAEA